MKLQRNVSRIRTAALDAALFVQALILVFSLPACGRRASSSQSRPPVAQKIPKELAAHGGVRVDNYYWLNERDNPKVIEYLKAENDYLKAVLKPTEALQETLFKEMVGRMKQTDASVPYRLNGYDYFVRFEEGKEYPLYCRKRAVPEASEEILINGPQESLGQPFYDVSGFAVSHDNNLLAYGLDTVSRRLYTLYFKNLKTGERLPDSIPNTSGEAAWLKDNKTIVYILKDLTTLRPFRVFQHVLGQPVSEDGALYTENDTTFELSVSPSKSRQDVLVSSTSTLTDEYLVLDAARPETGLKVFAGREKGIKYSVERLDNTYFILTNWQARNFRLMETRADGTAKANWREVVPHREDVLLEDFEIFRDYLVLNERKDGLNRFRVRRLEDGTEVSLDWEEAAYTVSFDANPELQSEVLRYVYTSLTTPVSTYAYNMKAGQTVLLKREEVLGGFNPAQYHTERLAVRAADGVRIPISLVSKVGLEITGRNPLLLYGYGSYGYSTDPVFDSTLLSLLDRGFIYAIAHIRGGQEMGRAWYEDGKLLKKKNTFTDFIACAEQLVASKYTDREHLFAWGASAGGLLMGAVTNLRPDLFKGVIAGVPYVDVITTMSDDSIPLTTSEYDEWGNPADKDYYDYMLSYSPYDNIARKDYPAMLVTTGLHDSQVQYFEPAKYVAKMRALKTDRNPLLLYTNFEGGHGGASGRFQGLKERALEFAFLIDLAGLRKN